jgi:hypothetical protein
MYGRADRQSKMELGRKKVKRKLHEQWIKHADLPTKATPQRRSYGDMPIGRQKNERRPSSVYLILALAICIFILLVASVILLIQYY